MIYVLSSFIWLFMKIHRFKEISHDSQLKRNSDSSQNDYVIFWNDLGVVSLSTFLVSAVQL